MVLVASPGRAGLKRPWLISGRTWLKLSLLSHAGKNLMNWSPHTREFIHECTATFALHKYIHSVFSIKEMPEEILTFF